MIKVQINQYLILSILAILSSSCQRSASVSHSSEQKRPNVILVMADDLGWGDVSYNGHEVIQTPNLDAMARAGARFDRFYAAGPVCSPTRGSCLTGRNPNRYGIVHANVGHLKAEEINLAEVFKEKGYNTGLFGKWHLGSLFPDFSGKGKNRNPAENHMTPAMAGFDDWFATEFAVATYDPYKRDKEHSHSKYWLEDGDRRLLYLDNGTPVTEDLEGCDSEIIMDRALPFIEKSVQANTPFFTVIWFHAPHAPVVGHPKYMKELYSDHSKPEQHYYSVVTALDAQMGRLRAKLRELGVADNTILAFTSDNGPEGNPGKVNRFRGSAAHFRGRKRSLYEGGIRVPSLMEWPNQIKAGTLIEMPAVTSDYFPTFCQVLGYDVPAERPYDGISLLKATQGKQAKRNRPIGFYFLAHKQETLIGDRYKLVHNLGNKRPRSDNGTTNHAIYELYDLINDPSEGINLADQFPDIVSKMKNELQGFVDSCKRSEKGEDYSTVAK